MKLKYLILLFPVFIICVVSCSKKFLEKNDITGASYEAYKTTPGLDALSVGLYQTLKFHFGYEWSYSMTQLGTDEFTVGSNNRQMFNSYDLNLNSLNDDITAVWDNLYSNINAANILIENTSVYYTGTEKNVRLGEGYFFRAYNYFKLVTQYGGVPLKITQTSKLEYEFVRNTPQEVYDQIVADYTKAYELLPASVVETGRLTKWAAAHLLAKSYLFRASEYYEDWNTNTRTQDLNNAIKYADIVINSGHHTLASNFSDLWNYTRPDGANETNPEIILSAQFSDNTANLGRFGNQVHLYFLSIYQTLPGMQRDIPGDREFQRVRTTDYAMDVYDKVNDSRFWKSFRTRYNCNYPYTAPLWTASNAPDPGMVGKARFGGNDTAILYIINTAGDTRYTATNINNRAPSMFVRYFDGETKSYYGRHGNFSVTQYVSLSKYLDGSRNSVATQSGFRDGIIARLGETYLIAAEAAGRLEQYEKAVGYINILRERAAYKEGEDRSYYVDGGIAYKTNPVTSGIEYVSYSDRNTYFESNNLAETTASTEQKLLLLTATDIFNSSNEFYDVLGANSQQEKFVCFILNERSRELMGELMRWEDLVRTKTLLKRTQVFNEEARPVVPKHYLRPIPQSFLDAIRIGDVPLSAQQKNDMQNPGY